MNYVLSVQMFFFVWEIMQCSHHSHGKDIHLLRIFLFLMLLLISRGFLIKIVLKENKS